jgi:hypothetical protein
MQNENIDKLLNILKEYKLNSSISLKHRAYININIENLLDIFYNLFDKNNTLLLDNEINKNLQDYKSTNKNIQEIMPYILLHFINKDPFK